jgi:hypothetical protein
MPAWCARLDEPNLNGFQLVASAPHHTAGRRPLHTGRFQPPFPPLQLRFPPRDLLLAWLAATVFSGAPSTLHALATGADAMEATRAAGQMLLPHVTDTLTLFAAAAVVHSSVSLFWTLVFAALLPRRHVALWAVAGSAAVALLDLRVIAPALFPSVAALPFWPQFADHLAWGALLGGTLQWRQRARAPLRH